MRGMNRCTHSILERPLREEDRPGIAGATGLRAGARVVGDSRSLINASGASPTSIPFPPLPAWDSRAWAAASDVHRSPFVSPFSWSEGHLGLIHTGLIQ